MKIIHETKQQHIARLQADGREFARQVYDGTYFDTHERLLCVHGFFLKQTDVDAGGHIVVYQPCPTCAKENQ